MDFQSDLMTVFSEMPKRRGTGRDTDREVDKKQKHRQVETQTDTYIHRILIFKNVT